MVKFSSQEGNIIISSVGQNTIKLIKITKINFKIIRKMSKSVESLM